MMEAGEKARYIVLFGPPGAGKGTQAKNVSKALDLPSVSTGEVFRWNLNNKTELGRSVEEFLSKGELVPDDLTIRMVRDTLDKPCYAKGVILDGFPRTLEQAAALAAIVSENDGRLQVIFIKVDENVLVERIMGRVVCRKCGKVYHRKYNPPPSPQAPCKAGGMHDLEQRKDDEEEIITNRIRVYNNQTAPLIDYFERGAYLTVVDGCLTIEEVSGAILDGLLEGTEAA